MPGENFGAESRFPWTLLTSPKAGPPLGGTVSDAAHWQVVPLVGERRRSSRLSGSEDSNVSEGVEVVPGPQTGRVLSAIPWTNNWSVLL